MTVGEHALLRGVGALGYETAVTRYTTDANVVPHAHSFVVQTFADFGLIGIAVMLALLTAWAIATRRTLTRPDSDWRAGERAGLLTMLALVVTFGVHSAIDWTWFVPGTALPALLCAGWLAGRGPSADGVGLAGGAPASGGPSRDRGRLDRRRRSHAAMPVGRVAAAAGRERQQRRDRRVHRRQYQGRSRRRPHRRGPGPAYRRSAVPARGDVHRDRRPSSRPRRAPECRPSPARRTRRRGSSSASSISKSTSPRRRSARWAGRRASISAHPR